MDSERRAFLQTTCLGFGVLGIGVSKPLFSRMVEDDVHQPEGFTETERHIIETVQQHLFPEDGDGPSAKDLNAFSYLDQALKEPKNIADGDPIFIRRGVVWLQELSKNEHENSFLLISHKQQVQLLQQLSETERGENWMSLLIYYILEALLLDPVYGGNPEQVGWKWLKHQPGYPRPPLNRTYHHYQKS